jgi:hypothetical protein
MTPPPMIAIPAIPPAGARLSAVSIAAYRDAIAVRGRHWARLRELLA